MLHKLAEGRSLDDVLKTLAHGRVVYALEHGTGDQYHLVRSDAWQPDKHTLGDYRPVEPLKSLVFRPREFLGTLMKPADQRAIRTQIVFGVKNCDLSALKIHDHVFLNSEPVDPVYARIREKTILVSCDCTGCLDVCFCPVVGEQPYPKEGFDINISTTEAGLLLETGSARGDELLQDIREYLCAADDGLIAARDRARGAMYKRVADQAAQKGLKPGLDLKNAVANSFESELWEDFAKDCVECGACNFCCCTCHCFLLGDGVSQEKEYARMKQWDSCLFKNFARVAGGANPRSHRA
ncbi:MAG: 4Fe-4S dicluster domain-containing protein, partial [Kiritimatiellae bacterium]|nr:4Fe-4S dicluster domain-containing protein [Kiritimatiellia bacterium]